MKRTFSLGIVQRHATQFDSPLFKYLSKNPDLQVTVYYTTSSSNNLPYDPELNRQPVWDHDIFTGYSHFRRSPGALNLARFVRRIANSRHDLVIISGYTSPVYLLISLICFLTGTAVGLRSDTTFLYHNITSLKSRIKQILLPLVLKLFATAHPTGTLASEYLKKYGVTDTSIYPFPYNVDMVYLRQILSSSSDQQDIIKKKYGITPGDYVILGIMKFIDREDPLTLLYAFSRLSSNHVAHLVMVGDGYLREKIQSIVSELKIENVHLPGYVPYSALPWYYGIADVFVHTAIHESWGVSVNEAMACGLPVIVADTVGSAYDLVIPSNSGFIFKNRDSESLAKILQQIISDPLLASAAAKRANTVIEEWTFHQTEKQLFLALEAVAP